MSLVWCLLAIIVSTLSDVVVAQCSCASSEQCCSGIGGGCFSNLTSHCCQQPWAAAICPLDQTCCGYGHQNAAVAFCCPVESPICCGGTCCSADTPVCCDSFCCASGQVCGESSCETPATATPVAWSLSLPVNASRFSTYNAQLGPVGGDRFMKVILTDGQVTWVALVVDTTMPSVVCLVNNGTNAYLVPNTSVLVVASNSALTGYTLGSSCDAVWHVPTNMCTAVSTLTHVGRFVVALCYPSIIVAVAESGAVAMTFSDVSYSALDASTFVIFYLNGTIVAFDSRTMKALWSHRVFNSAATATACGLVMDASVAAACVVSNDFYVSHVFNTTTGTRLKVHNTGFNSTAGWALNWASSTSAYFWNAPYYGDTAQYQLVNMAECTNLTHVVQVNATDNCCAYCAPTFDSVVCGGLVATFTYGVYYSDGQCQPGSYAAVSPHSNATFLPLPSWVYGTVQLPELGCAFVSVVNAAGGASNVTFGNINDPSVPLLAPVVTYRSPVQVQFFHGWVIAITADANAVNVTAWLPVL